MFEFGGQIKQAQDTACDLMAGFCKEDDRTWDFIKKGICLSSEMLHYLDR